MADLNSLTPSESGVVTEIISDGPLSRRFSDIGLTVGATVRCLFSSPSGDPKAFKIRGAVIAIRKEDAVNIKIRRL